MLVGSRDVTDENGTASSDFHPCFTFCVQVHSVCGSTKLVCVNTIKSIIVTHAGFCGVPHVIQIHIVLHTYEFCLGSFNIWNCQVRFERSCKLKPFSASVFHTDRYFQGIMLKWYFHRELEAFVPKGTTAFRIGNLNGHVWKFTSSIIIYPSLRYRPLQGLGKSIHG